MVKVLDMWRRSSNSSGVLLKRVVTSAIRKRLKALEPTRNPDNRATSRITWVTISAGVPRTPVLLTEAPVSSACQWVEMLIPLANS